MTTILVSIAAGIVIGTAFVIFLIAACAKHVMGKALGW